MLWAGPVFGLNFKSLKVLLVFGMEPVYCIVNDLFRPAWLRTSRPDGHLARDAAMNPFHYPGFRRFVGKGHRYVMEWRLGRTGISTGRSGGKATGNGPVFICLPTTPALRFRVGGIEAKGRGNI